MTDPRIPDPAVAELKVEGRLIYRLEQRKEDDLSDVETAAMVTSLRSLADTLEDVNLDRSSIETLDDTDHDFRIHDDDPSNVSE